jgi:hypothetical protein
MDLLVNQMKSISEDDLKERILALVENQKRTKIQWLATIISITEEEIIELASELDLIIKDEFVINPQSKPMDLSKAEYDELNQKPAPTFCEAMKK